MIYKFIKIIIASDNYNRDELLDKIDVFMLVGRITKEQYKELVQLINSRQV